MRKCFVLSLFFVFIDNISSQNIQADSINNYVEKVIEEFKEIPGLAITVIDEGKPILTKAYGYSDIENKQQATTSTAYYVASTTKSFVGLLSAILEEEGLFKLNDPITLYAPIKNFRDKSVFEGITINDLLSHTSGIRNNALTSQFSSIGQYTRDDLNNILEFKTIPRGLSKRFRYDNLGYNILDIILYEEFGLNWKNLLATKIFKPLNFKNTSAFLSDVNKYGWDLAMPYTAINELALPTLATTRKNDKTFQAAGGLILSIEDATQWILANLSRGYLNGKQVIKESTFDKSYNQISKKKVGNDIFKDTGYGLGWTNATYKGEQVLYHYGGFDGAFAHISFMPEKRMGLAIFVNESHFGDNVSGLIAAYVYDLLLGKIKSSHDLNEMFKKVRSRIDNLQQAYANDRLGRKGRKFKLIHKQDKYLGFYKSDLLGTIEISKEEGKLMASLGISKSVASPSINDDSIRVEFRDSRGEDIIFVSNKEKVIAAVYQGKVYLKETTD